MPCPWQATGRTSIVGNYHNAATIFPDGTGQSAKGIAVQVICGLIKHQDVRVVPHGCCQDHLDLLATCGSGTRTFRLRSLGAHNHMPVYNGTDRLPADPMLSES